MRNLVLISVFGLMPFNVMALAIAPQFTGSLYMLDGSGVPFTNPQCPTCNASAGEIDKDLFAYVDLYGGTTTTIFGNRGIIVSDFTWFIDNLSFTTNPDTTISATGEFYFTNYAGTTISSFSMISQPLGANGEFIALDGDLDGIKGNTMIDGPFEGMSIFLEGTVSTIPVPAAVWLFGSGLIGLVGLARRKT